MVGTFITLLNLLDHCLPWDKYNTFISIYYTFLHLRLSFLVLHSSSLHLLDFVHCIGLQGDTIFCAIYFELNWWSFIFLCTQFLMFQQIAFIQIFILLRIVQRPFWICTLCPFLPGRWIVRQWKWGWHSAFVADDRWEDVRLVEMHAWRWTNH